MDKRKQRRHECGRRLDTVLLRCWCGVFVQRDGRPVGFRCMPSRERAPEAVGNSGGSSYLRDMSQLTEVVDVAGTTAFDGNGTDMSATTSASVTTSESASASASVALHSAVVYFYARFAVQAAESILIVFANLLTLVAVKRTRKLRETSANSLTASLALADGMIGVLLLPTKLASRTCQQAVWIGSTCLIGGPYYPVFAVSLSTLLAIAVDRCLAVGRPLTYGKLMTVKRTRTIALSIWITQPTPWEALSRYYGSRIRVGEYRPGAAQDLFPRQLTFLLIQTEVLLPIVANLVLYAFIYVKLRTRKPVVCPLASMNAVETSEQKEPSKQTKAFTKMMVLVLGYLIIASLPYYILAPMYKVNDSKTPSWYVYSFDAAMFLFFSNSLVNPLIYGWKNRHFRESYSNIWKCHRSERD